jgi:hypothetical protein
LYTFDLLIKRVQDAKSQGQKISMKDLPRIKPLSWPIYTATMGSKMMTDKWLSAIIQKGG